MSQKNLRRFAVGLLIAYGVQFAMGMVLNLFVELPKTHPGRAGDEYFSRSFASLGWALSGGGGPALFTHALIGALLFAGSVALFVVALVVRARGWRWATGVAAFFTLGAFFNGMSFLDYGEDFSSAIMAGCWLIAVGSVLTPLLRRSGEPAPAPSAALP